MRIVCFLFILLISTKGLAQKSKDFFKDKYCIYTKEIKTEDSPFFADFYIANINDTVFEVDKPFGFRRFISELQVHQAYSSNTLYTIEQKKDGIYYWFYDGGKIIKLKRYSFTVNDTIRYEYLGPEAIIAQFIFSTYTGIDSTIQFNGKSFRCRKFVDEYDYSGGRYYVERYIDKKSSMPLIVRKLVYNHTQPPKLVSQENFILRFTLSKSEVLSREFRYPSTFDDPDKYREIYEDIKFDTIIMDGQMYIIKKR